MQRTIKGVIHVTDFEFYSHLVIPWNTVYTSSLIRQLQKPLVFNSGLRLVNTPDLGYPPPPYLLLGLMFAYKSIRRTTPQARRAALQDAVDNLKSKSGRQDNLTLEEINPVDARIRSHRFLEHY